VLLRNEEKIRKQKNSLLWNHHKIWLGLLYLTAVIVLIHAFGASFSAVVGVYLGYRALRLVLRLLSLLASVVFTVVFIIVLISIISLLIFESTVKSRELSKAIFSK
jgi:succinate dehydrogenase hydrophobic anchor subunit